MREYSADEVVADLGPDVTMTHAVVVNATEAPDAVVFSRRGAHGWDPVTAKQFGAQVDEIAAGLIAAGLQTGDRIGLMSRTRYEWTVLDYAIWTAGGIVVPIYETSSAEQVAWILGDSGARALFCETAAHRAVYDEVAADLPEVAHCWQIDQDGPGDTVEGLVGTGRDVGADALAERRASVRSDDLATIVYTSGTTGRPKGCELTHLSLLGTAMSAAAVLPELFNPDGSTLLFLPVAHIFGRLIQCACVTNRVRLGHTADIKNLVPDLAAFSPTFLLSVPRVFEKVYGTYRQQAHASGKGAIFDRGERVAIAWSRALDTPGGPGLALKAQHALFEKVLYGPRLRAPLGGQIAWAVSGGAPLGERLGHFFRGIGITILEGYGLTETVAAGSVNTPAHLKIGTVGQPSPGCAVRIADDGEILVRGRSVFRGYWQNDEASHEALTDGWFHTGDIGELDDDAFLRITGRKKELLVTAGGKNVAPAPLEDRLRADPLISQALVVGDAKPFVAALVTLDPDALGPWLAAHGKPAGTAAADLVDDADLQADVQKAVDTANRSVSKAESIRAFRILPEDFSEAAGNLTPSMKVKRAVVMDQQADTLAAIYGS